MIKIWRAGLRQRPVWRAGLRQRPVCVREKLSGRLRNPARRILTLVFVACLLVPLPLRAETLVQKQGPAMATLSAPKLKDGKLEIALSGELILTLSVVGIASLDDVKPGKRLETGSSWQVTTNTPQIVTLPDGKQRWEQVLHIEPGIEPVPMLAGEHKLKIAPLEYRKSGGSWQKAEWQEFLIAVSTTVKQGSLPYPPPNIEETPREDTDQSWLFLFSATAAAVLAFSGGVWLLYRRRGTPARLAPPEKAALEELDRLRELLPDSLEESGRFHTGLANIVRAYLEARFQVPAPRQTTEEYCQALAESACLNEEQLLLLRDVLRRCDLPKFAPLSPTADECLKTVTLARTLIEKEREMGITNSSG